MGNSERFSNIALSRETQKLPVDTKRMFVEMVSLYTGFIDFIPEKERIRRAEKLRVKLESEHDITIKHPAVIAALLELNQEAYYSDQEN